MKFLSKKLVLATILAMVCTRGVFAAKPAPVEDLFDKHKTQFAISNTFYADKKALLESAYEEMKSDLNYDNIKVFFTTTIMFRCISAARRQHLNISPEVKIVCLMNLLEEVFANLKKVFANSSFVDNNHEIRNFVITRGIMGVCIRTPLLQLAQDDEQLKATIRDWTQFHATEFKAIKAQGWMAEHPKTVVGIASGLAVAAAGAIGAIIAAKSDAAKPAPKQEAGETGTELVELKPDAKAPADITTSAPAITTEPTTTTSIPAPSTKSTPTPVLEVAKQNPAANPKTKTEAAKSVDTTQTPDTLYMDPSYLITTSTPATTQIPTTPTTPTTSTADSKKPAYTTPTAVASTSTATEAVAKSEWFVNAMGLVSGQAPDKADEDARATALYKNLLNAFLARIHNPANVTPTMVEELKKDADVKLPAVAKYLVALGNIAQGTYLKLVATLGNAEKRLESLRVITTIIELAQVADRGNLVVLENIEHTETIEAK